MEAMTTKHRKQRGPKCHYCKKYGHIQRYCIENERIKAKDSGHSSRESHRPRQDTHKFKNTPEVNNVKCKLCLEDSSDSDDIGLVAVDCATSVNVTASPGP